MLDYNFQNTIIMAAQAAAGPSNAFKTKGSRTSTKVIKSGKAKKISEKQRIFELEKAALEFVSFSAFVVPSRSLTQT